MTVNSTNMTSCLPGADSGGSQGSGLASINDSTMGSGSVNASPVLSPTEAGDPRTNPSGLSSFSATSLASPPTSSAPPHSLALSPPVGASGVISDNNNHLSAAAAAAAAGLNLSDCDPTRFAGLSYPRLSAGGLGSMYSAAAAAATYPSNEQNPYPSIAMADNSFYGPLVSRILFFSLRALTDVIDVAGKAMDGRVGTPTAFIHVFHVALLPLV